jgi:Protein of unknown function (DUF3606)
MNLDNLCCIFHSGEPPLAEENTSPPEEASRINIHDAQEVEYWTKKCGCTREELEAAVQKVGVDAFLVEAELKQLQSR